MKWIKTLDCLLIIKIEFATRKISEDSQIAYQIDQDMNNVFVAGWARQPSTGLAGQARKRWYSSSICD